MDSPRERSRSVPTAGVHRELRLLPRAGIWCAGEPLYAGDPAPLRGGVAQPQPQLHLAGRHLRSGVRGVLGDRPPLGFVDPSLFRGAFCLADGGEESPRSGAGRRLHPPAEAVAGVAVYSCHPRVLEQGVAAPVVLPPERRRVAPTVLPAGSHRRHRRLASRDPARETEESRTPPRGPEGVAGGGTHRCGSDCRHPPSEGASLGGAAAAALGDDPGGRLGGLANVP